MNNSVYVAKLGQQYDKTLNNFLLHVPNDALKDMHMLNYGTINNINSFFYSSIDVLIDFNSFTLELLMVARIFRWKLPSSFLLSLLSTSGYLMISAAWSINFQMFFFYVSLISVSLFSICQLIELLTEL